MKALSVLQPWASLIALGAKRYETRSWQTRYRGRVAIHASAKFTLAERIEVDSSWWLCGALGRRMGSSHEDLPTAAVLAFATLVDCIPTERLTVGDLDARRMRPGFGESYAWTERQLGDFTPGRFAWLLEAIQSIDPVPARGSLGLWEWNERKTA